METTLKFQELKEASFNYQFTLANNIEKKVVLETIEDTLAVYRKEKYKEVEGIDFHINEVETYKKIINENDFPTFNPIQYLRNQIGTDPKEISNIEPESLFGYLRELFYKSEDGIEYFENLVNELNKKTSICSQAEYLNLELVFIGYHSDKFKKKKIKGTVNDSSHLSMASFCDEFITNDYKLAQRAKAISPFLNNKTKVKSIEF